MKIQKPKPFFDGPFRKGKYPCPLCGGKNRMKCLVRDDEGLIICANTPNRAGETDAMGRFKHKQENSEGLCYKAPKTNEMKKASESELNRVYSAFLERLVLNGLHAANLESRGLTPTEIRTNGYKSVPSKAESDTIVFELEKEFNLEGVPGFYQQGGQWCLHMMFPGFYVPYRNKAGDIVGLQIRLDKPIDKQKYVWLSSKGKEKGVSSDSPFHYARPDLVKETETIYVTEGGLKADIIAAKLNVGVVAGAGVFALKPSELRGALNTAFPGPKRIVVALDNDWRTKSQVKDALGRLLDEFERDYYVDVQVVYWDDDGAKGLDDLCSQKGFSVANDLRYMPVDTFKEFFFGNEHKLPEEKQIEESYELVGVDVMQKTSPNSHISFSWDEFDAIEFPPMEKIVFGLQRGNVGLLVATTNIGKSTLVLNLAASITSGRNFRPLFDDTNTGKRVLYIDGEATKAELQADIRTMLNGFSTDEKLLVGENFHVICDAEVNGEPLDLVNMQHRQVILEEASKFRPDLIVIDTMSALLLIEDENDNAIVKKEVVQPLKKLAKDTNASVLLLHHTGKYNEGYSPAKAYIGRGASAFGALARLVLNLETVKGQTDKVNLICSKTKGENFAPVTFQLNSNARWFQQVEHLPPSVKETSYETMVEFVRKSGKKMSRGEIAKGLSIPYSTLGRYLKTAETSGDLHKFGHGLYVAPIVVDSNKELALRE